MHARRRCLRHESPEPGTGRALFGDHVRVNESGPVVEVRDLHVRFGDVEAVSGVDLAAYAGRATGLLGRNGAGKSTTMRVLAGVVPPTAGVVRVAGHDIRTADARRQARGRLLPRRRRPGPARHAVGAPPAVGAAAPAARLGAARPRPARAVRARRRRAPSERRLLARHGPAAVGAAGGPARARGAAARRAVRRGRPDRRRGDPRRDRRRPGPRRVRPGLDPPARARDRGLRRGARAARRIARRDPAPPTRWRARRARVPTVRSSTRAGLADELRAVADVGHLLRFRAGHGPPPDPVHLGGRDPGHGHRRRGDRARLPARRRRQRPGDRVLRPDPDRVRGLRGARGRVGRRVRRWP